ncbi:hypothetical protein, partial [Elstera sp.]|uniref:hypothetical protein n=1 Tax=Elstera sp. TaxID=1916664 RepID=UPI0037C100E4
MREGISDRYLEIAFRVLSYRAIPMNCKDMINFARKLSIIPIDLKGETQHKTLNARISTDIL